MNPLAVKIFGWLLGAAAFTVALVVPSPFVETVPQGAVVYRIDCGPLASPAPGEPGEPGEPGADGQPGQPGADGLCGPQGPVGPQGECGPQGEQGEPGPQGEPGEPGPAGAIGPAGECGPIGPAGPAGPQGPIGLTGATGPTGPQGEPGVDGAVGATGATGATGPQGPAGITIFGDYGSFYHGPGISPAGADIATVFPLGSTTAASGISIQDGSKITVSRTGVYSIQFSAQLYKGEDNRIDEIDIWLTRNGVNVPSTNTRITLDKTLTFTVAAWNFVEPANAGDYFELVFSSNDATVIIAGSGPKTAPDRPAIPSLILTINQVG